MCAGLREAMRDTERDAQGLATSGGSEGTREETELQNYQNAVSSKAMEEKSHKDMQSKLHKAGRSKCLTSYPFYPSTFLPRLPIGQT